LAETVIAGASAMIALRQWSASFAGQSQR